MSYISYCVRVNVIKYIKNGGDGRVVVLELGIDGGLVMGRRGSVVIEATKDFMKFVFATIL